MNRKSFKVHTVFGTGTLKNFYVTDLGHLMAKVYYPLKRCWINHRIKKLPNISESDTVYLDIYS